MEINDNKQEKESNNATKDVNSSIMVNSEVLEICREVITKRQKPKRLAAVVSMCWEVLFAMGSGVSLFCCQ
jgi:hypothetical protein